ncbi:MAG: tetratricopeptide repeat protein [Chthoniobacterales bacterium]
MPFSFTRQAFFITIALLATCLTSWSQSADELMAKGNVFEAKFEGGEALKFYLPAEKLEPKNVKLLTRIARAYRYQISDSTKTSDKLRFGALAVAYAERAAALGPDNSDAQLAVAISYGKLQPLVSSKEKVRTARIIRTQADKAIQLDPRNDLAWHVLGRWKMGYAELTGLKRKLAEISYGALPTPTYGDAASCFEKAIALKPERVLSYMELGQVYSAMGRTEDAKRLLNQGLGLKQTDKEDPDMKQQGRELLTKLR